MGKYLRLYRALARQSERRTPRDIVEIRLAIGTIQDPFIMNLEEPVLQAICSRVQLEEFAAGDLIFDYLDPGDRLYLILGGRVSIDTPKYPGAPAQELVQ